LISVDSRRNDDDDGDNINDGGDDNDDKSDSDDNGDITPPSTVIDSTRSACVQDTSCPEFSRYCSNNSIPDRVWGGRPVALLSLLCLRSEVLIL